MICLNGIRSKMWVYTTTISVYHGSSVDEFGNKVATNLTPSASGIPASIHTVGKSTEKIGSPGISRSTTNDTAVIYKPITVSIGDRIEDSKTGIIYLVDEIYTTDSFEFFDTMMLSIRQIATAG